MGKKIIIYQIFTRLYGNRAFNLKENGSIKENGCGKFSDFSSQVLSDIKEFGISHVWFTGIIRHASQTDYRAYGIPLCHPAIVKGRAGSPYAIADYYDVDPDLADDVAKRMQEFESLVVRTHDAGLNVIIDFVPNHVARQYHSICKPKDTTDLGDGDDIKSGFNPQNNFYYCPGEKFSPQFSTYVNGWGDYVEMPAKATGNDRFDAYPGKNDWYETVKLNYGVDYLSGRNCYFTPVPNTWNKMLDILMFWGDKGIDGFRCDMAEMVPVEFWKWAIAKVKTKYPNLLFIGEVYNPNEYRNFIRSGFDYLYDKVGMYDTMRGVICGNCAASSITRAWQAVDDIKENMLNFLENHDEQRLASDFFAGDGWRGIPALASCILMSQSPFMIYAGQEYGERGMDKEGFSGLDGRTTIFDYWSLDTLNRAKKGNLTSSEKHLFNVYKKLLTIATKESAVINGKFFDLMYVNLNSNKFDSNHLYTFLRKEGNELLLVVSNFSAETKEVYICIPSHAFDYLGLPEGKYIATDLLGDEVLDVNLNRDGNVKTIVRPWGVHVYKIDITQNN